MDRETWHATVHGVTRARTWPRDWTELKSKEDRKAKSESYAPFGGRGKERRKTEEEEKGGTVV